MCYDGAVEPGFVQQISDFAGRHWRDGLTILILWVAVYYAYLTFRATRGARIFLGLVVVLLALTLASEFLGLAVIGWVLKSVSVFLAVALVVIFQPELRRVLAELGSSRFLSFNEGATEFTEHFSEIIGSLAHKRIGALIALQRGIDLKQYLETGVEMDCLLSPELIQTIFHPNTALHDGGVILRLRDERILGAGCVFPLSQRELVDRAIGLRHRAAMGVSEESDAIAIVVSEETGHISIAVEGALERDLDLAELRHRLNELLFPNTVDEDESSDNLTEQLEG